MKETGKAVYTMVALCIPGLLLFSRLIEYCPRLALGFVLAGILFGIERLIGCGLMETGVLLAVIDIYRQ